MDADAALRAITGALVRRGRTNQVVVEVMNMSRVDLRLNKGTLLGSLHTVGAVIPMMSMVNKGHKEKKKDKDVVSAVVNAVEEGSEKQEEAGVSWDLSHLDEMKKAMLEEVLIEMKDVFSKDDLDIGDIKDFQMPINLVDDVPVTARYRRIPPHL